MLGSQAQVKRTRWQWPAVTGQLKRLVQGLLLVLLTCQVSMSQAEGRPVSEYNIKAAFLYNFSSFISWPEKAPQQDGEFQLCVLGNDPFGEALETLSGKSVHGLSMKIRRLGAGAKTDTCQLVYISESETKHLARLLSKVRARPVLTVSDIDNFVKHGGIIRFKLVDNKVRFVINVDAAERAGLKISSKLLSLAIIVKEDQVTAR